MTSADTPETPLYRWRFGSAEFDESRLEVRVGGLPVELEPKPLQVLSLLLRHAGEVVTKQELFDVVWSGRITVDHVLATAVGKLRKALGGEGDALIVTVPRVGYRLDATVERLAVGRGFTSRLRLEPGQPVPSRENFLLEEPLGRSLGSEVWLAVHARTKEQRVYKFALDGERLSSLKREATLARVLRESLGERPDFARVLDWNFEREPYFLECAWGGVALPRWFDEGDGARTPQDARVLMAADIAEAVAAAHGVGVLHKDLKPANVLVAARDDGSWQVRLTDFGSSRLLQPGRLEELGITSLGMTVTEGAGSDSSSGTPLYLAPELIAGQAPTVRSDVYALGVMLYQLVVGDMRRPMAPGWERDVDDPLLREDIALATDGDPALRLEGAGALALRLRTREARREERSREERARLEAETTRHELERARARRPWTIATVAALALGLVASMWFAADAARAKRGALQQAARAEAIGGFLQDLLVSADPTESGRGHDVTVREALERASGLIEGRFSDTPLSEASVRLTASEITTSLGDYDAAVLHLERAIELLAANGAATERPRLMAARYRLGETLARASRYDDARRTLEAADAQAAPEGDDATVALAAAQAWGRFHLVQAQAAEAAPRLEAALAAHERGAAAGAPTLHALLLDLAQCYVRIGRAGEAIAAIERARGVEFEGAAISDARRANATLLYGASLLYAGRAAESEPVLERAIAELDATYGPGSLQSAQARATLGGYYAVAGRFADALPLVLAARDTMCGLHGATHQSCLMQVGNEGVVRLHLGETAPAVLALRAAHEGFVESFGAGSPGVHVIGYYLALALLAERSLDEALSITRALDPELLAAGSPGRHWDKRVSALEGAILVERGDRDEGLAKLEPVVLAMEADGMQEWILAPFRARLERARAAR